MDKVYYLPACDTCQKILKSLPENELQHRDIKSEPISEAELKELRKLAGSHEALFSKRALLYKSLGLKDKALSDNDYKKYILQHYTFLSRPVFVIGGKIYIGNSKKNVENVISALS